MKQVRVELTWKSPVSNVPSDNLDLDACAFMLDNDGKLPGDEFFVFYNNLRSPSDAVVLKADDIDGADGEVMFVNLEMVPPQVKSIVFLVSIYNGMERTQSFDQVTDATVALYDRSNGQQICLCPLTEVAPGSTTVKFCELRRNAGDSWEIATQTEGYPHPLAYFVEKYSQQ